jgi:hypothetical protein
MHCIGATLERMRIVRIPGCVAKRVGASRPSKVIVSWPTTWRMRPVPHPPGAPDGACAANGMVFVGPIPMLTVRPRSSVELSAGAALVVASAFRSTTRIARNRSAAKLRGSVSGLRIWVWVMIAGCRSMTPPPARRPGYANIMVVVRQPSPRTVTAADMDTVPSQDALPYWRAVLRRL